MDNMGGPFVDHNWILPPSHRKAAIPWKPLCPFIYLHLLLHYYRWPKGSLSGKALIVLEFRAEIIINAHPIAVHGGHFRKDAVSMIVSLPFECSFDLPRH